MRDARSLWEVRRQAERALSAELKPFSELLDESFATLDEGIARLERLGSPFGRVCALVAIKGRNLALGCYSLSLDALAQEAGALFRPLVECQELLTYFRLDQNRINEALEDRLPLAGHIAREIDGKLKGLRDHLNQHASHVALSFDAMAHLIDFKTGSLRPVQTHKTAVLHQNVGTLLGVLMWLAAESARCIDVGGGDIHDGFADRFMELRNRAFALLDDFRRPPQ